MAKDQAQAGEGEQQSVPDGGVTDGRAAFLARGRQKVVEALAGVVGAEEASLNPLDRRIVAAVHAMADHLLGGPDADAPAADLPAPRDERADFIDGKPAPHMVAESTEA